MPEARTTQSIHLFLRAEVIANKDGVARDRAAIDSLQFEVVETAKWLKFRRIMGGVEVLLDVMVGPLGVYKASVKASGPRVRPMDLEAAQGLHARRTDDEVGIEQSPMRLPIKGVGSDGSAASCEVLIRLAFPYAPMKLGALRDRINDTDKQEGRHHAMDLYRIVGMLTEEEAEASSKIALQTG